MMRMLAQLVLLLAVFALPTHGQTLDIPELIQIPNLSGPSWASDLVLELDVEINELSMQRVEANNRHRLLIDVAIAHRAMAGGLLAAGERAGAKGSYAIINGAQLARSRHIIDGALDGFRSSNDSSPSGIATQSRIAKALLRFVESQSNQVGLSGDLTPQKLDQWLVTHLSPLAEVISHYEGQQLKSHWISQDEIDGVYGAELHEGIDTEAVLDSLQEANINVETQAALTTAIDLLSSAQAIPSLRIKARAIQLALFEALQFGKQIDEAGWLPRQQRQLFRQRWEAALIGFSAAESRKEAQAVFRELERLGDLLGYITAMHNHRSMRVQPSDMVDILRALEKERENDGGIERSVQKMAFTLDVLSIMFEYRSLLPLNVKALPQGSLRGDLARTERQIDQQYKRVEREVIAKLPTIIARQIDRSNPAVITLVTTLAEYLDDLKSLRSLDAWYARMIQLDPSAHAKLANTMRRLAVSLLKPREREKAIKSMSQLGHEMSVFVNLPGEEALVRGDFAFDRLSGGQADVLAKTIEVQRRKWVNEWAMQGNSGSAAFAMEQLVKTMSLMSAIVLVEAIEEGGETERHLEQWAGWPLDQQEVGLYFGDLSSRLALAVAAANEGRYKDVEKQNQNITNELAVAELAARLQLRLGLLLSDHSEGATGVMNRLVFPPNEDSWLYHRRSDLAELGRYMPEITYRESRGQADEAEQLQRYVSRIASDVLQDTQLNDQQSTEFIKTGPLQNQSPSTLPNMGGN